tara:strand:+ start:259 stop:831 length:573 start_codon:yes stop_codon:yes gene_type:complete
MITKRVVRQAVKARQGLLTTPKRKKQSALLNHNLRDLLASLSLNTIACFLPTDKEPDIDINFLLQHYEVLVPKFCNDSYEFVRLTSLADIIAGPYGIFEPKDHLAVDIDVIQSDHTGFLVPGLAFDYKGNRIGYGKGIYDRLLLGTRGIRIGVCFQDQLFASLPSDSYDQHMMYVVHDEDFFPCVGDDGY